MSLENTETLFHNKKKFDRMRSIMNHTANLEKDQYRENKDYKENISSAKATYKNTLTQETLTLRYERTRK